MMRLAALGVLALCAALGGTPTEASQSESRSLLQTRATPGIASPLTFAEDPAPPPGSINDLLTAWLANWSRSPRRRPRAAPTAPVRRPAFREPTPVPAFGGRTPAPAFEEPTPVPGFEEPTPVPAFGGRTPAPSFEEPTPVPGFEEPTPVPAFGGRTPAPALDEPTPVPGFEDPTPVPGFDQPTTVSGFEAPTPVPAFEETPAATSAPTGTPATGGIRRTIPQATGQVDLQGEGIRLGDGEVFDGGMKRYFNVGDGSQLEGQQSVFRLNEGAVLKNVIIGAPAGDGVSCQGNCQILNVWWEDVGEDAMTSRGGPGTTLLVDGGGAFFAEDKGLSVNYGGNVIIRNFYVDGWTRAFRTGGGPNVKVLLENVVMNNGDGPWPGASPEFEANIAGWAARRRPNPAYLAGYNAGHEFTFRNVVIENSVEDTFDICRNFEGDDARTLAEVEAGVAGCIVGPGDIVFK